MEVGDSAVQGQLDCSDGSSVARSWSAEMSHLDPSWLVVHIFSVTELAGETDSTEFVRHINLNGITQGVEWYSDDSAGTHFDLTS
jgi:hypothetical protein